MHVLHREADLCLKIIQMHSPYSVDDFAPPLQIVRVSTKQCRLCVPRRAPPPPPAKHSGVFIEVLHKIQVPLPDWTDVLASTHPAETFSTLKAFSTEEL